MATLANIFTLKLENKDFNTQLQTSAKTAQDYNNKIANSLLEAALQHATLIGLTEEKADAQRRGDKESIKSINQQIAATKSLIQVENQKITQSKLSISSQVEEAKKIIALDGEQIRSKNFIVSQTQKRNEVLSSLAAQRVSEEKARYQTLSSLAAQKSKEASDIEIHNASERNRMIASLSKQAEAYEKQRYQTLSSLAAQKSAETASVGDLKTGFTRTYESTPTQNKYNDALARLNALRDQGIITLKQYNSALEQETAILKRGEPIRDSQFNHMIRMLRWAGTLAAAYYGLKTAWDATLGTGIQATAQFEQMETGIASLIAVNSQNTTSLGRNITASEKFAMAQKEATKAVLLLRKANIDTPANLEQITKGFQAALGPALTLGFNIKQTVEYSRLMTIAAMSMQVPMEQLAQEMRSVLDATVDQNSIVAKNLGLTNPQLKAHRDIGDSYEFLMKKLGEFNEAGKLVGKQWPGVTSDLSDAWRAFTSDIVKSSGIFEGLKSTMVSITEVLKNQNGEIDTLKRYIPVVEGVAVALGTLYVATKAAAGAEALYEAIRKRSIVTSVVYDTALLTNVEVQTRLTAAQTAGALATSALGMAMRAVPFIAVAGAVAALATSFFDAQIANEKFGLSLDETKRKIDAMGVARRKLEVMSIKDSLKENEDAIKSIEGTLKGSGVGIIDSMTNFSTKARAKIRLENESQLSDLKTQKDNLTKTLAYLAKSPTSKTDDVAAKAKTEAEETLVTKKKEKDAEELAKEAKKREAANAKANREAIKGYDLEKQRIETQIALKEAARVQEEVSAKVDVEALREKFKLEFALFAQAKAERDAKIKEANAAGMDADTRNDKILKAQEAYANTATTFGKWELSHQEQLDAKRLKAYEDATKAAYILFDQQTAIAARISDNIDRGFNFTSAFGKNKIGIDEYKRQISELETAYLNASSALEISDTEGLAKLDNLFASKVDFWKNKLAEIPDIELKMSITGIDATTNALASITNSMSELNKKNRAYNTFSEESAKKIKDLGDDKVGIAKEELKLGKLTAQNDYDRIEIFQSLAGAVSGVFEQGSREAAAFQVIQSGLALTNAVASIANAGMSSPWTGLATAAAMAAYLTPMLGQIGVVLGAGNVSTTYDAFAAQKANTGIGTTLGGSDVQSKSITNALEIMGDLAKPEFALISQMNKSLLSIDQKISGLSANILQAGGFAVGEGYVGAKSEVSNTTRQFQTAILTGGAGLVTNAVAALTKDIPLLGQVTGLFSNVVGSIVSGVFGGGSETTLQDAGISFADQFIQSAITGLEGQSYQVAKTVTDGGWFSGDSESYDSYFSQLDEYTRSQFQMVLGNLYEVTIKSGEALGVASGSVQTELSDFMVSIGKISLKDKTGAEIKDTLTSIFGKVGDELAKEAFPALVPFQQVGEGLYETMTRVATGMEEADYYVGRLGKQFSTIDFERIVNQKGDVAFEALRQSIFALEGTSSGVSKILNGLTGDVTELYDSYLALDKLRLTMGAMKIDTNGLTSAMLYGAGGLNALSEASQSYVEGFLTSSEQTNLKTVEMTKAFVNLGFELPTSKLGFTNLLKSINTTTASGQELSGRLLLLAKGFNELIDPIETEAAGLRQQADLLNGVITQREIELANINDVNKPLQKRVWLLEDEKKATEASNKNIKSFTDSFKSQAELVADMGRSLTYTVQKEIPKTETVTKVNTSVREGASVTALSEAVKNAYIAGRGDTDFSYSYEGVKYSISQVERWLSQFYAISFENVQSLSKELTNVIIDSPVGVASNLSELNALFLQLSESGGELTDAEYAFLQANKALIDANTQTGDSVSSLGDAIEKERLALQEQIDLLTGVTTLRAVELNKINEVNRPLQERIWLLEDEKNQMEMTTKNSKTFLDGLKTNQQLAEDMAASLGVQLANNVEGLASLYTSLMHDTNGLTDADLALISANKDLLESTSTFDTQVSELNKTLDSASASMSTLKGVIGDIESAVESLRAASRTPEQTLQIFYTSMIEAQRLAQSDQYDAYAEAVKKATSASSALLNADNFTRSRDMRYAQAVAANQFEELGAVTKTELSVLEQIELNTRTQIDRLSGILEALSVSVNTALLASIEKPTVVKPTELPKSVTPISSFGAAAIDYWASQGSVTPTMAVEIAASTGNTLESVMSYLQIPSFAVGTPNVPYDMQAQIHQGEIIAPKTMSDGIRAGELYLGKNDNSDVVSAINGIINVLNESRDIQNASYSKLKYIGEVI